MKTLHFKESPSKTGISLGGDWLALCCCISNSDISFFLCRICSVDLSPTACTAFSNLVTGKFLFHIDVVGSLGFAGMTTVISFGIYFSR